MDNTDFTVSVIAWCFLMALMGIPYFIYETTSAPYYVTQTVGFDIVTVGMALITFIPFIRLVFKK